MIGIYKITSPSNRIYIGQSIDIEVRFKKYKNNCRTQKLVKHSFEKYGINNHIFEVIEECDISKLNERERYWQDFYDVLNGGLNCRLTETTDKSGKLSEETKRKVSEAKMGIPTNRPPWNAGKICPNLSKALKGKLSGEKNPNFGKSQSEYNKLKSREANLGRKDSIEVRILKGVAGCKLVMCTQTGIFYESATEASLIYDIKTSTLQGYLSGNRRNKTSLIYV